MRLELWCVDNKLKTSGGKLPIKYSSSTELRDPRKILAKRTTVMSQVVK